MTSHDKGASVDELSLAGSGSISRLQEQLQVGHLAWLERLQEMQAVEAAFAAELLVTTDSREALKVCNRWIAKRLELLTSDSKAFTGFWMDLVVTVVDPLAFESSGGRR